MMDIGIIGLGLIGGSLGLALRSLGFRVLGVSRRSNTCKIAREMGAVDEAGTDLSLLSAADLVFICTPIDFIVPTLNTLVPYLKPGAIVTDVGSVKESIVSPCSLLWPDFVGGHPMAGTAEQGIEAALTDLFLNAPYVITPLPSTPERAIAVLISVVERLGCRLYTCSPGDHDRAVAYISHLPVMVSAALINTCTAEEKPEIGRLIRALASSGFRDTSRVGGGNPELGLLMALYNRSALLACLRDYRATLDGIITAIDRSDRDSLEALLISTRLARPDFIKD